VKKLAPAPDDEATAFATGVELVIGIAGVANGVGMGIN